MARRCPPGPWTMSAGRHPQGRGQRNWKVRAPPPPSRGGQGGGRGQALGQALLPSYPKAPPCTTAGKFFQHFNQGSQEKCGSEVKWLASSFAAGR